MTKPRWFLGSDRNFAAQRSAAPTGRATGSVNLGSDPKNARSRISLLHSRASPLMRSGAALSPRRATYFSLSRQRNLRKRKATLLSASLRFAAGNLRCSLQAGSRTNSPSAQTSARPDPLESPLLGATTRVCGALADSGSDSRTGSYQPVATILIAASACIYWSSGQKHSKNRPFQGSYRSKTGNNRSSSRIHSPNAVSSAGNRAATLTSARLSLGYFSLAKQRQSASPAGAKPGRLAERTAHPSETGFRHPLQEVNQ